MDSISGLENIICSLDLVRLFRDILFVDSAWQNEDDFRIFQDKRVQKRTQKDFRSVLIKMKTVDSLNSLFSKTNMKKKYFWQLIKIGIVVALKDEVKMVEAEPLAPKTFPHVWKFIRIFIRESNIHSSIDVSRDSAESIYARLDMFSKFQFILKQADSPIAAQSFQLLNDSENLPDIR